MGAFVYWDSLQHKRDASLTDLVGIEHTHPLVSGVPYGDAIPSAVSFSMRPDEPKRTRLTDSPPNTSSVVVASGRLADFFRQQNVPDVEYLPVTILDPSGAPTPAPYWILHPVHPVDCLDLDGAGARYSAILPGEIAQVERLRLHEDRVPPEKVFFRARSFTRVVLVRRALADAISARGFTGIDWMALDRYGG